MKKVEKNAYALEQASFWALVAWFAMTVVFLVAWIMAMVATGNLTHAADLKKMKKTASLTENAVGDVINGADTVATNILGEQCSVFDDLAKGVDKSFVQKSFEKQLREFPLLKESASVVDHSLSTQTDPSVFDYTKTVFTFSADSEDVRKGKEDGEKLRKTLMRINDNLVSISKLNDDVQKAVSDLPASM